MGILVIDEQQKKLLVEGREIRLHTSYSLGILPNPLRLKTDTPRGAKDCARIHTRSRV